MGVWALPAVTLSVVSMVVLVVALLVLLHDSRMRSLFRLPVPPVLLAGAALGLTWWIARVCSGRPGRHLPRYWVLTLAIAAGGATVVSVVVPFTGLRDAWLDASCVALLASSLSLLPRLIRLRPESRWIRWVAPTSIGFALLLVLLPSMLLGRELVELRERQVERRVERLRSWAAWVAEASEHDWGTLPADPKAGEEWVRVLSDVDLGQEIHQPRLWSAAAVLGRDTELATAVGDLVRSVADAVAAEDAPRLAAVSEPPVRWDRPRNDWVSNPDFPLVSAVVGDFYRETGRLYRQVSTDGVEAGSSGYRQLREEIAEQEQRIGDWLRATGKSWSHHWVVPLFAGLTPVGEVPTVPELSEVLRLSLLPEGDGALVPADLWQLMSLPVDRMRRVAERAPACHRRAYEEEGVHYERLDCYAFEPAREGRGAELRIELRLVYTSGELEFRWSDRQPVEGYFLFPVSHDRRAPDYADRVIGELFQAVSRSWDGGLRTADRGGTALRGFWLEGTERDLRVYAPRVEDYLGDGRAVIVRCRWSDRP